MSDQQPSSVVVMDQYARDAQSSDEKWMQTPLAPYKASANASAQSRSGTVSTVKLHEASVTGLLVIRAKGEAAALNASFKEALSVSLPPALQSAESSDATYCIRWMSPDEWLLSCPLDICYETENMLRKVLPGSIAIVNVSGGYSLLTLSGESARKVMMKSTGYDVSTDHFPVGKVVNTMMAKAQVTLRALAPDSVEIIVRRSFADYLWRWLQRAGDEYGLQLDGE